MTPEEKTRAAYTEFLEDRIEELLTRGRDFVRGASCALVLGCLPGATPLLLEAMADAHERGARLIPWGHDGLGCTRDMLDEVPRFLRHIAAEMREGHCVPRMPRPPSGRTVCFCGGTK